MHLDDRLVYYPYKFENTLYKGFSMQQTFPTILITGGAGFIGSNFVRYMRNTHLRTRLINLDALTYAGNLDNLSNMDEDAQYTFIQGDITDHTIVDAAMAQCEWVIHFAAESHVDRSLEGPEVFIKSNVLGTQILLEYAKKYNIKKFVHVSTDEVYGSLGPEGYFTEETPLAPNSPYAASKAGSDLCVRAYHETFGFPAIITRCSNNYGPYQFPEKLIPLMISNALVDKSLPVYGDGLHIRDWLYVEDHCRAIDAILHYGKNGEVYNIGGHNTWANIDIVKFILKALNKPESLITYVNDRPGHDRRYAIDASKIKSDCGWEPMMPFEAGLEQTIQWYLQHQS